MLELVERQDFRSSVKLPPKRNLVEITLIRILGFNQPETDFRILLNVPWFDEDAKQLNPLCNLGRWPLPELILIVMFCGLCCSARSVLFFVFSPTKSSIPNSFLWEHFRIFSRFFVDYSCAKIVEWFHWNLWQHMLTNIWPMIFSVSYYD